MGAIKNPDKEITIYLSMLERTLEVLTQIYNHMPEKPLTQKPGERG